MKPLYIFRHSPIEGPGYLAEFLDHFKIPYVLLRIDAGEAIPQDPDGASGLVFMGGPMSVNDELPWIAAELALIRRAAVLGMPVLGHCLGGQLMSKALGGTVGPNAVKEIGWFPVQQADNVPARDWLHGLPESFEVFHWHGETFTLPTGATPVLRNSQCANQGFVLGNMLALQCHIEMTEAMVHEWVLQGEPELTRPAPSLQDPAQIRQNLPARIVRLQEVAHLIYTRWLRPILSAKSSESARSSV